MQHVSSGGCKNPKVLHLVIATASSKHVESNILVSKYLLLSFFCVKSSLNGRNSLPPFCRIRHTALAKFDQGLSLSLGAFRSSPVESLYAVLEADR